VGERVADGQLHPSHHPYLEQPQQALHDLPTLSLVRATQYPEGQTISKAKQQGDKSGSGKKARSVPPSNGSADRCTGSGWTAKAGAGSLHGTRASYHPVDYRVLLFLPPPILCPTRSTRFLVLDRMNISRRTTDGYVLYSLYCTGYHTCRQKDVTLKPTQLTQKIKGHLRPLSFFCTPQRPCPPMLSRCDSVSLWCHW
jgi:hypothetical protein